MRDATPDEAPRKQTLTGEHRCHAHFQWAVPRLPGLLTKPVLGLITVCWLALFATHQHDPNLYAPNRHGGLSKSGYHSL
jgi:hypothetical protein